MLAGLAPNRKMFAVVVKQVVTLFAKSLRCPLDNKFGRVREAVAPNVNRAPLSKLVQGRFTDSWRSRGVLGGELAPWI